MLLSELQTGVGSEILQKFVGESTGVAQVQVGSAPGLWISGAEHVYLAPSAPPRLAGNALLWSKDGIVYRLEGPEPRRGQTHSASPRQITGT